MIQKHIVLFPVIIWWSIQMSTKEIFKKVFPEKKVKISVKKRVTLDNPSVTHIDKKKEKSKKKCREKFTN
jgi:hypothetical protein